MSFFLVLNSSLRFLLRKKIGSRGRLFSFPPHILSGHISWIFKWRKRWAVILDDGAALSCRNCA